MATFDFKSTFDQIGKTFIRGLKRRIENQVGIDGAGYAPPKPSTLKSRKYKHGRGKSSVKRLHVSYDTANRGFNYVPDERGVTVFVPDSLHMDGGATYRDIIKYNSRGQANVNTNVDNPPLVFPSRGEEVLLMQKELDQSAKLFASDLRKQLRDRGIVRAKTILTIG